jgi:hypothetical protein
LVAQDGYAKFCNLRRKIRADRIKMKQEQQQLEKEFWDRLILYIGGGTVIIIGMQWSSTFLSWRSLTDELRPLIFLIGAEIQIEAFQTMRECEARKSEIYEETGGRARCLWIQEPKQV